MDTNCTVGTIFESPTTGRWQITGIEFFFDPYKDETSVLCTLIGIGEPGEVCKPTKMDASRIIYLLQKNQLKKVS